MLRTRILSGQHGSSRSAWSGDPVLPWKANLIGLSQTQDLYFVAVADSICVDRPGSSEVTTSIRWKLPKTADAAATTQHHTPRYPHSVNRLEIGYLGAEEILVCVCDDGDVVVYTVNAVQAAFHAFDSDLMTLKAAVDSYLKNPLYHYNVGTSAWGIAISKEARLIAVSSNRAEITCKAAALAKADASHALPDPPVIRTDVGNIVDRGFDHHWKLKVQTNTPSLSFFFDQPSQKLFLVSSDIGNNLLIWDMSVGSRVCAIHITYHDLAHQYGWLAFTIGPETFRLVDDPTYLHGCASDLECSEEANVVNRRGTRGSDYREQMMGHVRAESSVEKLPFSIVHTSAERVTLFHEPHRMASVFLAPWREDAPPFLDLDGGPGTNRYGLTIPELGVVAVGADLGHVGIFSLTRLTRGEENDVNGLGLRLESILPYQSQFSPEQRMAGFSGLGTLLGIAARPVRGSVRGKYLLVLEYSDRSILTYELWRDVLHV